MGAAHPLRWCSVDACLLAQKDPVDEAVEQLIKRLFELQDLNSNGVLEEGELIQLNKKVAMLHHGKDNIDKEEVREKYQHLFRSHLDKDGEPVPLRIFRSHILDVLEGHDSCKTAQTYILEQWIAEADMARDTFCMPSWNSLSDVPFLLVMPKTPREAEESSTHVPTPPVSSLCKHDGADELSEEETAVGSPHADRYEEEAEEEKEEAIDHPGAPPRKVWAQEDDDECQVPAPPPSEVPTSAASSLLGDYFDRITPTAAARCRKISEEWSPSQPSEQEWSPSQPSEQDFGDAVEETPPPVPSGCSARSPL